MVARSGPDLVDGYRWTVAVLQSPFSSHEVVVESSLLIGRGASINFRVLQKFIPGFKFSLDSSFSGAVDIPSSDKLALRLIGSISTINAALDHLIILPPAGWSGSITFWARVYPRGYPLLSKDITFSSKVLPVNDAPLILWRASQMYDGFAVVYFTEDEDASFDTFDSQGPMAGIRIFDSDAGAAHILTLRLIVGSGRISIGLGPARSTWTYDQNFNCHPSPNNPSAASREMFLNGTQRQLNEMLEALHYLPPADWHGEDWMTIRVEDNACNGLGGHKMSIRTLRIAVNSVNDGPILLIEGTTHGGLYEDYRTWEAGERNVTDGLAALIYGISLADVDANEEWEDAAIMPMDLRSQFELRASVTHGILWSADGRSCSSPLIRNDGSPSIRIRGDLECLNSFLGGLMYLADFQYYGLDVLHLDVSDLGNQGKGGAKNVTRFVNIRILAANDRPFIQIPANSDLRVFEDSVGIIGAAYCYWKAQEEMLSNGSWQILSKDPIKIIDPDIMDADGKTGMAANGTTDRVPRFFRNFTASITVAHGTFSLRKVKDLYFIKGDGLHDHHMVFVGSLENINGALEGATYLSDANWNSGEKGSLGGSTLESIELYVDDGYGQNCSTVLFIYVEPANDFPQINVLSPYLQDVLSPPDPGDKSQHTATIYGDENDIIPVEGLYVSDVDVPPTDSEALFEISIYASNGTLTLNDRSGLRIFLVGDGSHDRLVVFRATLNAINKALEGLVYQGNKGFSGADTIIATVNDLGHSGYGPLCSQSLLPESCHLASTIRIPLVINMVANPVTVLFPGTLLVAVEDQDLFIEALSVLDCYSLDAQDGVEALQANANSRFSNTSNKAIFEVDIQVNHGTWALGDASNVIFHEGTGNADMHMRFSGDVETMNYALKDSRYRGLLNYNSLYAEVDEVHLTVSQLARPSGEPYCSSSTVVLYIRVEPVNDPPVILVPGQVASPHEGKSDPSSETASAPYFQAEQGRPLHLWGLQIVDVDMEAQESYVLIRLSVNHGVLLLRPSEGLQHLEGSGEASRELYVRGSLNVVNNALNGLAYTPNDFYAGEDAMTIEVKDQGGILEDEKWAAHQRIDFFVNPVNHAPLWLLPSEVLVVKAGKLLMGLGVQLYEVDVNESLAVQLDVDYGSVGFIELPLSLSLAGEIRSQFLPLDSQLSGANVAYEMYGQIKLKGNVDSINEALKGLVYQWADAEAGFVDAIHFAVEDSAASASHSLPLGSSGKVGVRFAESSQPAPFMFIPWATYRKEPCQSQDGRVAISRYSQPAARELQCKRVIDVSTVNVTEDSPLSLFGIQLEIIQDLQEYGRPIKVELESVNGTFQTNLPALPGLLLLEGKFGDRKLSFQASVRDANNAFSSLYYQGAQHFFGPDVINILISEVGGGPVRKEMIPIHISPVNDRPVIDVSNRLITVIEDTAVRIEGLSISDPDWDAVLRFYPADSLDNGYGSGIHTLKISTLHGQLMLGRTKDLKFNSVTSKKGSNSLGTVSTIKQSWTQDAEVFTVQDLTLPSGWIDEKRMWFSNITFSGRLDDINSALSDMIYLPDLNWNSLVGKSFESISLAVRDEQYGRIHEVCSVLYVQVTAANDPPEISIPGAIEHKSLLTRDRLSFVVSEVPSILTDEDTTTEIKGLSVRDVDLRDIVDAHIIIKLEAIHGMISFGTYDSTIPNKSGGEPQLGSNHSGITFLSGNGRLDSSIMFSASLDNANRVLNTIYFTPEKDYFGDGAALIIHAEDHGASGEIGDIRPGIDRKVLPISVRCVNDPPEILLPKMEDNLAVFFVEEDEIFRIKGAQFHPLGLGAWSSFGSRSQKGFELWRSEAVRPDDDSGAWGSGSWDWRYTLVKDIFTGLDDSSPSFFCEYNGLLYFQARDPNYGTELWRTDGTKAGTVMVKDLNPGQQDANPSYLVVHQGYLYFQATGIDTTWMMPEHLSDECAGYRRSTSDDRVFFAVSQSNVWNVNKTYDCPNGYHWATTREAYALFKCEGHDDQSAIKGHVYFGQCGWQGYYWGGQKRYHFRFRDSSTTLAYKDAGKADCVRPDIDRYNRNIADFAGIVCVEGSEEAFSSESSVDCQFHGEDVCKEQMGARLWRTDGTQVGTKKFDDVNIPLKGRAALSPSYITAFNGALYFSASLDDCGEELFRSTGSEGGTHIVKDIHSGVASSSPRQLLVCNDRLFFSADDGLYGRELWASDGHLGWLGDMPLEGFSSSGGSGTRLVTDIQRGSHGSNPLFLACNTEGTLLFFQADDGKHGPELWVSDGTKKGTEMVADIYAGCHGSNPSYLIAYSSMMYFQADDGYYGAELWCSDGTSSGTKLLQDIRQGSLGSFPSYLTVWNTSNHASRKLFAFFANDGSQTGTYRNPHENGISQLWISAGTRETTSQAFTQTSSALCIESDALDSRWPPSIAVLGGSLYFSGSKGLKNLSPKGGFPSQNEISGDGFNQAFLITDVDQDPDDPMIVNITCNKCSLTIVSPDNLLWQNDSTNNSSQLIFSGTIHQVNFAMRNLLYQNTPRSWGWDTVNISVTDKDSHDCYREGFVERNSSSCALSPHSNTVITSFQMYIIPHNHPPVITLLSTSYAGSFNAPIELGKMIIEDPDMHRMDVFDTYGVQSSASLSISLHVTHGRLSLASRDRLTFITGDGTSDRTLVFEGALTYVNKALEHLVYECLSEDEGIDKHMILNGFQDIVNIRVDDNGQGGAGGNLHALANITIDVSQTI